MAKSISSLDAEMVGIYKQAANMRVVSFLPKNNLLRVRFPQFLACQIQSLEAMRDEYSSCTQVSPSCPVSATTYGYYPNLGANAFFLALFTLLFILHIPLTIHYRLWTYSFAVASSCFLELLGYAGRLMMHSNPWSENGFRIQIICLVFGPSFLAAGIYLTLKHLILHFGAEFSRLKPRLYTWVFIGCDVFSIITQSGGGGVAVAGKSKPHLATIGNDIIVAGISFQVVTMGVCGLFAIDYAFRLWKSKKASGFAFRVRLSRPHVFCITSALAYVFVLIRCIYRVPEMAGGWGNKLMRRETEFLVLDGLMIAFASILLTVSHPGFMFPGIMGSEKESHRLVSLHSAHQEEENESAYWRRRQREKNSLL
ncbi:uncharacterized protein PV09_07018 [Verruconis gallopava]|uniref:RTA1 domain-containing protein n=1 Tax=Verruconis gallopava TaxID=253628 RepID=A0A0D2A4Z2_9PEZI|nr:uncharacterized protein PV09_07018 [Verruconis gallopava]KIW01540.1 hypothetical protein PV09_07018 [Verruconis gallopava]